MYILKNKLFKFVFVCLFGFIALSNAYATDYYPANTEEAGMCIREKLGVDTGISTAIKALWCPEITTTAAGTSITLDAQSTLGTCKYTTTCSAGYHIRGEANTVKTKVETTLSNSIESESSVVLTAVCVKQEITCSAGTYLKAGDITSSSCATCPDGSYCPGGTFTYTGSAQGKIACPAGTSAGTERAQCALCSAGTTSSVGANTCTTCPNAQNVASSNGWVEPSLSDTSWTLSHTPTVNHLCEVNNCAEKYAYSVENRSGKNLFDKSLTKITTLSSMLSAQKPAYVAANFYTGVDADSEIGSTNWVSINGEGIMIDYTPGDSFYVYFFNGNVPISNAMYAWTLLDADGKALVKKESYMPGSIITPTAVEGARYFLVQWATSPSNITNYQNIIDGLMITKNQTATEYEPYSASAYQNACNPCPAGSYCLGGQDTGTVCPIGSYSAGNTDKCTVCGATADTKGKTTSGTGKTSCDATCENKDNNNVKTWGTASWNTTTHTADNVCKATACNASYAFTEKVQSGSNLVNINETPIDSVARLTAITKPTPSRANVYAAQNIGNTITFTAAPHGIAIPCNVGESFGVSNFGTISTNRRYYVEVDSNGVVLVSRTSYTSGTTITVSNSNTKYLLIEWTTDSTDNSQTVVVRGSTAPSYYIPYGSAYINSCTACPSGSYCLGDQDTGKLCPIGSYSTGGTDTCIECADSKTTNDKGSENSDACMDCPNKTGGVANWANNSFDSTTGTMSNLCSVTGCNTKYEYNSSTLPSGYTRLEYIEANGTQQIDTGLSLSNDTGTYAYTLDMEYINTTTRTVSGYGVSSNTYIDVPAGGQKYDGLSGGSYSVKNRHTIEVIYAVSESDSVKAHIIKNIYLDGALDTNMEETTTSTFDNTTGALRVPAIVTSYPLHARIYGITQHKDGVLIANLIPAINSSGTIGMYDTESRSFLASANSGTSFIAGPIVSGVTGSCALCTGGAYCTGDTTAAQACAAGQYSRGGVSSCTACASGSYSGITGQARCVPCTNGTSTGGTGRSSCDTKCSNNSGFVATWTTATWSTNNTVSNSCTVTNCSAGAYYDASASNGSCTACPTGSYQSADAHTTTTCTACGMGTTSSLGATSESDCTACPNAPGVYDSTSWTQPEWNSTTKTVDNKCELTGCEAGYKYNYNNNSMLPDGYTAIQSLKQTSGTGYIDTGYKTKANTKVETRFKTAVSRKSRVFGNYESSKTFVFYAYSGSFYSYIGNSVSGAKLLASYPVDTNWHTVVLDAKNKKMIFDNEIISGGATLSSSPTENMVIFAGYATSTIGLPFYGEIEYFKIYEEDELKHYFVPAKRDSDRAYGMYDIITNEFKVPSGSGTFTEGSVESPTSEYTNICTECVAGNYCPGGIGDAAKQEACTVGSWSDDGASKCETCTPGKTTRGTGTAGTSNAICTTNCPWYNDAHFTNATDNWKSVSWNTNNTVTNLCKFANCNQGYSVEEGTYTSSLPSGTADQCNANTIWIDWQENGGTPIDPNGSCEYDSTITFPSASATQRPNFRFNGWAL